MPTYEFRCPDGTIIERIFKMSEVPSEIPAPDGSGMAVRVISGGAGLIFKGTGFYITDYGKDGKKDQRAPASAGDGSSASSDAKVEGKGEAKGEAKSDAKVEAKGEVKRDPAGATKGAAPAPSTSASATPPTKASGGE